MKQFAKRIVRNALRTMGWDIVQARPTSGLTLDVLKLAIENLCSTQNDVSVIQIGANDGSRADPIHEAVKSRSLRALLVEPLPDMFADLKRNYAGYSNCSFENSAVSNAPGKLPVYRIGRSEAGFPDWVHGIATLDKDVLLWHRNKADVDAKRFTAAIEEIVVPVITFSELLDKHPQFREPTILQVDAEGHDAIIIGSALDAGALPCLINFEHRHLSLDAQEKCRSTLAARGYRFWTDTWDTLAMRV